MGQTVEQLLAKNMGIVQALPNLYRHYLELKDGNILIRTHSKQQFMNKSGTHIYKSEYKNALVLSIADNSRKIYAYARSANNTALIKSVKYSESELRLCSDDELLNIASGLYEHGQNNLSELVAYGITEESQTEFLNITNNFGTIIPQIQIASFDSKEITQLLNEDFRKNDLILVEIDAIIEILRVSNPTFYKQYKEARKIKTSYSEIILRGLIIDASTGEFVKNADITISPNADMGGKDTETITKTSTDMGKFYVKTLSKGIYTISVSKLGYVPQSITVTILDEEPVKVDIKLVKA